MVVEKNSLIKFLQNLKRKNFISLYITYIFLPGIKFLKTNFSTETKTLVPSPEHVNKRCHEIYIYISTSSDIILRWPEVHNL